MRIVMQQEELASETSLQVSHITEASNMEFRARSYQLEMLEQSLRGNVIVAMDTGSGKTEIAVMRIRAELDRCASEKRVWFLAPTVALCEQQHKYIQSRLPDTSPLLLIGSSHLDYWSEQSIWDAALHNHRVVISTHAILLDAMQHGFVQLASLALLVFDEAHHCNGKHPANLIMELFYHRQKRDKGTEGLPHVLGLSASPVRGSKIQEIHQVEQNLDSICITPRTYRQELLAHVNRPVFTKLEFSEDLQPIRPGSAVCTLRTLQRAIADDTENLLRQISLQYGSVMSPRPLERSDKERWTHAVKQYGRKTEQVFKELGPWAADYFVQKSNELYTGKTDIFKKTASRRDEVLSKLVARYFDQSSSWYTATTTLVDHTNSLSHKAAKLVNLIGKQGLDTTGVIFVKERVIVSVLFHILSTHPQTAERFKFATFVGLSNNIKKKAGIHELLDLESQNKSLEAFRARQKHIIIATDVLEEGIDVAACNLVICFDPPTNLKSFIQRRGRARKKHSQFIIMQSCTSTKTNTDRWTQLEEEVSRLCQDEKRARETILTVEDEDEVLDLVLHDRSTGAILTAEATKAHLHHFCNTLPKQPFVDTNPGFSIEERSPNGGPGLLTARVALPNCVGSFPRSYLAPGEYRTERAAYKAVAYQCYKALHGAGLVNNNFLPSILKIKERCRDLPPMIEVDEHRPPWRLMAEAWSSPALYKTTIQLERNRLEELSSFRMSIITPMSIPVMSWPTSKQHTGITLKQTSASDTKKLVISFAELERLRQSMISLCSRSESQKDDTAKLDFVYIFDFDDGRELSSQPAPVDVDEAMTQIIGQVEKFMIADLLQTSILQTCTLRNAAHIVTAITAPSADAQLNFERYEFFGDAVLKMVVSAQLFTDHVSWPAGWLSQYRDNLTSNASLANAALSLRLDQYILTRAPRTRNWALPRISDADCLPGRRMLSCKTLADVSQALFAAAYLDAGHGLARSCIKIFIPEIRSERPTFDMPHGANLPTHELEELQQLTGHQFRNITVLLQALTHPSCASYGSEESYQRLAFLGDAVLGFLIAKILFQHLEELSEGQMTKIRAAVVNSNMLGYICMTHSIPRKVFDIETITPKRFRKVQRVETMPLWKYMRYESKDMGEALDDCNARYRGLCGRLQQEIQSSRSYPWITLAELQPEGFYSDLVQSVIGAIYVDSGEDWGACQQFIETIGMSSYIERMVRPDYDVAHPRSALQQLAPLAKVRSERSSDGIFRCWITLDEVEIASAESYKSEGEASILASHRAVQLLAIGRDAE